MPDMVESTKLFQEQYAAAEELKAAVLAFNRASERASCARMRVDVNLINGGHCIYPNTPYQILQVFVWIPA